MVTVTWFVANIYVIPFSIHMKQNSSYSLSAHELNVFKSGDTFFFFLMHKVVVECKNCMLLMILFITYKTHTALQTCKFVYPEAIHDL